MGYVAVTESRICSAANISRAVFREAFGTPEQVAELILREQFAFLRESLHTAKSPELMLGYAVFVASCPSHGSPTALAIVSSFGVRAHALPASLKQELSQGMEAWSTQIAETIAAWGREYRDRAPRAGRWIAAALLGVALYCDMEREPASSIEIEALMLALMAPR